MGLLLWVHNKRKRQKQTRKRVSHFVQSFTLSSFNFQLSFMHHSPFSSLIPFTFCIHTYRLAPKATQKTHFCFFLLIWWIRRSNDFPHFPAYGSLSSSSGSPRYLLIDCQILLGEISYPNFYFTLTCCRIKYMFTLDGKYCLLPLLDFMEISVTWGFVLIFNVNVNKGFPISWPKSVSEKVGFDLWGK